MKFIKTVIFLNILSFFVVTSSYSQQLVEKFQDWTIYEIDRGDKKFCYLISLPIATDGRFKDKNESYFLVTQIKNDADEISLSSGFLYDESSDVEISFKSKKFYLFPFRDLAWAHDKNGDIDVIKEMQKSDDMVVVGFRKNGKLVADTYSLIGFDMAYAKMKEVCKKLR